MVLKHKKGFSLAEMMIVMLIVALVLAATAPMITRKVSRERSDKIFDMLNTDPTNAVEYIKGRKQRIFMNGKENGYVGIVESGVNIPANSVLFGRNTTTGTGLVGIGFNTTNNANNSIAIGYGAVAGLLGSIAVGHSSKVDYGQYGIAIGDNAVNKGLYAVTIGYSAKTDRGASNGQYSSQSIAIGYNSKTIGNFTTAIGAGAVATGTASTAIGYSATAPLNNTIVLGTGKDTVYIPGNLIVAKTTLLGSNSAVDGDGAHDGKAYPIYAITHNGHDGDGRHFGDLISIIEANHADDYKGGSDWPVAMIASRRSGVQVGPYKFYGTDRTKWSNGLGDNQKICPPVHSSSDWYRKSNGDCTTPDNTSSNTLLYSDSRLKDIGEFYTGGLDELSKLNFYHYTLKSDKDKTPQVGVIAQDLQKVFPDAVKPDKDGWLTIRWDDMFFAAINAIKELNAKITEVTEKVCKISSDLLDIKSTIEKQQTTIAAQAQLIEEQQAELKKLSAKVEKLEKRRK